MAGGARGRLLSITREIRMNGHIMTYSLVTRLTSRNARPTVHGQIDAKRQLAGNNIMLVTPISGVFSQVKYMIRMPSPWLRSLI